jgi:hypothetical protein
VFPQAAPNTPPEPTTYIFSPRELQRLAVYRAAVVARFYNDECEGTDIAPRQSVTNLFNTRRAA